MPIEHKVGRLSNKEKAFIKENASSMSLEEIAKALDRTVEPIQNEIRRITVKSGVAKEEIETQEILKIGLKQSAMWGQLKNELEPEEVSFFEERYLLLMKQFKDDVFASEESQIFKAIKYEIMLNRNAVLQKKINKEMRETDAEIDVIQRKPKKTADDKMELDKLRFRSRELLEHRKKTSEEYTRLDEKHQTLLEDLKATRKQRVDKYDNSKTTFLDIIKMLDQSDKADAEGREAEMMRIAMEKEDRRLGAVYKYADNTLDRPVLNGDTVNYEDE